jgi:pimeloyl-ACP methyl ester carboxylesterase
MRASVGLWRPAVLVPVFVLVVGCGGAPAEVSTAPSPEVIPVASCVTDEEQVAGGVRLPAADPSATVDALVLGHGSTGLVLANMSDTDLCDWKPLADEWSQKGYQALIFNYSGTGPAKDMLSGAAELRRRGATKIFLIGASMGGTAALGAGAAARPAVAGVISLSGPAAYAGVDAAAAVRKLTVPVLFLVGENDEEFVADAHTLYAACIAKDKKLVVLPTGNHGTALIDDTIDQRIQTFLSQH